PRDSSDRDHAVKAALFAELGPADVLHVADVPDHQAAPGQVRVRVRAASVNPVDWKLRSGSSPRSAALRLPHVTGLDFAGVVDQVGDEVDGVAVGDAVLGTTDELGGALAELVVATVVTSKPEAMSWAEAAALPSAVETARRALLALGVEDGQLIVINGAAGGVGLAAVQLAMAAGARVVATASAANHGHLRGLGALVTTYGDGLPGRVAALTGDSVDLALDVAGSGALPELIAMTGSTDAVVTLSDPAAADLGVRFTTGAPPEVRAFDALALAARLHGEGAFSMPVAATYALADAAEAHRRSEVGHVLGKVVVTVP
ncbi:MAG: putative oxidoreductase, partial [Aeromicrobium sp.]|nr:putative oxidoreductase [Aeromicrobium sp.]